MIASFMRLTSFTLLVLEYVTLSHSLLNRKQVSRNFSVSREDSAPRLISTVNLLRDFANATYSEAGMNTGESLEGLRGELNDPALSGLAKHILLLSSPPPPAANHCPKKDAWDQYVICEGLLQGHKMEVHAYGIKGYDVFGAHMAKAPYSYPVHLYDCFDTSKPENFPNVFHPTCVAAQPKVDAHGHRFETIHQHVGQLDDLSAIVKLDVEGAEFDVLSSLKDEDARKIAMLTVEYHSGLGGCGERLEDRHEKELVPALENMQKFFSVVEGYGIFWGTGCKLRGYEMPQALAVTYVNKRMMSSK